METHISVKTTVHETPLIHQRIGIGPINPGNHDEKRSGKIALGKHICRES
jgi:hypothetical protein